VKVRVRKGREKENRTPREGDKQVCGHVGFHDFQTTALLIIFLIVLSRIFQDAIKVITRIF
jgi:hypothetical protein